MMNSSRYLPFRFYNNLLYYFFFFSSNLYFTIYAEVELEISDVTKRIKYVLSIAYYQRR